MISFVTEIINFLFSFISVVKNQFLSSYIYGFSFKTAIEISVVCLGFVFIHLVIKENPYAWLVATYNCSMLVFIWGSRGYIGQVALYTFYVVNSLYAFYKWRKRDKYNKPVVKLKWLNCYVHILQVISLLLLVWLAVSVIEYLKKNYGIISNGTVKDMVILIFSLYALVLQIKKNIEGMIYFAIVDAIIFSTYLDLGLLLLATVRGYITVMSVYGSFKWISKYLKEKKISVSVESK